ncbi:MAG: arylesterase [Campylobacter sp.]
MRKFYAILLAALVALSIVACGGKGKERPLPAGSVVVALGDSITQGVGTSEQSAWPALLGLLSGWRVINAGVSGDTSAQALARLPALLREYKPALVIVSIGGNDFLRRQPASATRANIAAILRTVKESASRAVLIGIPKPTLGAALGVFSDHELHEELAKEYGVPLLSGAWGGVMKQSRMMFDQIHPNGAGYTEFTVSLEKFLRKQGFLR